MQELRLVAVSEDGTYLVLATAGRGTRFTLPVDDRLRAAVRGNFSRLGQYEIEVESPLRPKEIQARIRAGETAEEIAATAGIPVERVRWFEGPVLQEREYMAQQAQRIAVRLPGESGGPRPTLGELVAERLTRRGVPSDEIDWDSCKRDDGLWRVKLGYVWNGHTRNAEWLFDPRRRHITPHDDEAMRLSAAEYVEPTEDTTVTPFVPRLAAKLTPVPPISDLPPQLPPTRSDVPGQTGASTLPPVPADPDSDLITADSIIPPLERRPPSGREPLGLPAAILGDDGVFPAAHVEAHDTGATAPEAPEFAPVNEPSGQASDPSAPEPPVAARPADVPPAPEPAVEAPAPVRPAPEPMAAESPASGPAADEGTSAQPSEPGHTKPGHTEPGHTEPATADPAAATPAAVQPAEPLPPRPAPPVPAPAPSAEPDLVVPEPRVVEPAVAESEPIVAKVAAPPVARKPAPPAKAPAEPVAVPAARTSDAATRPADHKSGRPSEEPAAEQAAEPAPQPAPQPAPPQPSPPPQPAKPVKAPRSRKGSRSRRASVPTWDEIMFGARRPD